MARSEKEEYDSSHDSGVDEDFTQKHHGALIYPKISLMTYEMSI